MIVIIKLLFLFLYNSEYNLELFQPFLNEISEGHWNPWNYYVLNHLNLDSFPYHGLMLYVLYPFVWLGSFFGLGAQFIKIPLLFADLLIYYLLLNLFKTRKREVFIFYFLNPIIFYSTYIYSQLDILPTAFLFICIFFLVRNKIFRSAVFFGLAISTKLHVLLALPLLAFYILKKWGVKSLFMFLSVSLLLLVFCDLPFIWEPGFLEMVLYNSKQNVLFDTYYSIGNASLILPVASILVVYFHFFNQEKVNQDLLFFYFGLLFTIILLFMYSGPAWYVWMVPFVTIFFIKNKDQFKSRILYIFLSFNYIIFFVFFYKSEYRAIHFSSAYLDLNIQNERVQNILFTALEVILLIILYSFYSFGIKSNSIYRKENLSLGIGGDSGVGKSRFLGLLSNLLREKVLTLEGDGEHKWERGNSNWKNFTHLDPKANNIHKQADAITELKENRAIYRSEYDHTNGTFTEPLLVKPKEFIVIAGLHPFYLPKLRKIIDLKIFIDTDERLRRHWKIIRDTKKRGYTIEKITEQINSRLVDASKYIHPQKEFADIIICYFPLNNFEEGNIEEKVDVGLKITLNANIHLEGILSRISGEFIWDYNPDLTTQFLEIRHIEDVDFEEIAAEEIPNLHEIIVPNAIWDKGFDGLVQLLCLKAMSDKLQEV